MGLFGDLFQIFLKAVCGPIAPEDEKPPQQQQQQQAPYKPHIEHVSQHQQQQQQQHQQQYQQEPEKHKYGKQHYQNDYLANAQDPHYVALRKRGDEAGKRMGELFGASKEAYERGDGAEAKRLSNEAKALREEKERLHDEAADWIFLQNNEGRQPGEMDLHGLRAEEAVERTERFIIDSRKQGLTELRLIVGKGLHSQNHVAVLKPRIEELMQRHNIVAEIDPDNSGVLLVHLNGRGRERGGRMMDSGEITRRLENEDDKGCIIM